MVDWTRKGDIKHMDIMNLVDFICNNGVAIGVLVYLLWERKTFNETITNALKELKDTTQLIKDYFLERKRTEDDNK